MSDDLYGTAATEQAHGLTPMGETTPPPDEEKTYASDIDGLKEAAAELAESRISTPLVERKYVQVGGDNAGEDSDPNETINLKRGIRDLSETRAQDAAAEEAEAVQATAAVVDAIRSNTLNEQVVDGQQQPEIQPQPEMPDAPTHPGIDPEIAQALQNPKIRQALEAEVASAENARQQYAHATSQAAQVAAAALYSSYPELAGLTAEQLPGALHVIARDNPSRYVEIKAHLDNTRALYGAAQQAQQAEQQIAAARFHQFSQQHDAAFERSIASEPPEIVKQVKSEFLAVAEQNYGVSRDELAHVYRTQPIMHTAAFQRMMYDATKYQLAMRGARAKAAPAVPTVQRPGVTRAAEVRDEGGIREASDAFRRNPTPRNAAALLRAKRAS